MRQLVSWWSELLGRNSLLWTAVTFSAVYLVFSVGLGDVWLRMWLKGSAYEIYQVTFVLAFVVLYALIIARRRDNSGLLRWALTGLLVGYSCGLLAYLVITLFMPDGADRIFRTWERSTGVGLLMVFVMPGILLNWAIGLAVGVLTTMAFRHRDPSGRLSNS
jgi:hypothetical protein